MLRSEIPAHLKKFRDPETVKTLAMNCEFDKLDQSVKHGFSLATTYKELYGFTLVHIAIESNSLDLLIWLIQQKADLSIKDVDGNSPLVVLS